MDYCCAAFGSTNLQSNNESSDHSRGEMPNPNPTKQPEKVMKPTKIAAALMLVGASLTAQANDYSFGCVTQNIAGDCAIGQSQLGLSVTSSGSFVDFYFSNSGPAAASITDIYFDWSSSAFALSSSGSVFTDSGAGVSFSWGAAPPDLPGGQGISFVADLAADSDPSAQPNGVNPGEWLNIRFAGESFANVVAGLNSGDLRVGIHVQGFATGGSESFVTTPIPEPETYAMLLAGLGLMGFVARRRKAAREF